MSGKHNLYIGRSGQMAVMAEFLARGYNVALPQVDVGEDIFVVRDFDGDLARVQVKTATSRPGRSGFSAQFVVPLKQLATPSLPEMNYVLAVRHEDRWSDYIVIDRKRLEDHRILDGVGTVWQKHLLLYLRFTASEVMCSSFSLQRYRNVWDRWPTIRH